MTARGDRVLVRDRPWVVEGATTVSSDRELLNLRADDDDEPRRLSVASPPESVEPLPTCELRLERRDFDSYASWSRSHQVLAATSIRETGLLTGARFGRVVIESYQLAPALRLIQKPRPSLLIADDVGLGKTVEAGLAMLELMARGRAKRVLVVVPPGLVLQWHEELQEKFGLRFTLIENAAGLARAQTDLPAGVSPWDALPHVITSVDYLKKETVRNRALRKRWDLAIIDEAHALSESGSPRNPYRTQRTRLGLALRDACRGLILLTATPHNGYRHSFRSLVELVEPTRATLEGGLERTHHRVGQAMIRRMKRQIKRRMSDGSEQAVFPTRTVRGIQVSGSREYLDLLRKVGSYCSRTTKQAGGTEDEDLIGFAMQIVKKRSLSSRLALEETIAHRLEALRKEAERESPPERNELRDLQAELPLDEARAERTIRRLLRSAIPKDERRRKSELRALNAIRRGLKQLPEGDPKVEALVAEIRRVREEDPTEKFIVFTEYRDTLAAIRKALDASDDLAGAYVVLRGGLSSRLRRARERAFDKPECALLLATDAASEGLNLQRFCRRVIHVELPWNPNRMEQRNGRVDRYGQIRSPQIRYLFYAESPEEDVLNQIVSKMETMGEDRVSTPDLLGILSGAEEVNRGLTELDPEAKDVGERIQTLVRTFEDRTADFVRNVQPILGPGVDAKDIENLSDLLGQSEPLTLSDQELEQAVLGILGDGATELEAEEGVFRIKVPLALRGRDVDPIYPAATFRREVAVRFRADEVDYLTPLHPLIQAVRADAKRRHLQVYEGTRGLPPRRLAATRTSDGSPASVLFTFCGAIHGGGGLVEEVLLPIRITVAGNLIGAPDENAAFLRNETRIGEVDYAEIETVFDSVFAHLAEAATNGANRRLRERVEELRSLRHRQAEVLRSELERDLNDRLEEIQLESKRARGALDEATGQVSLFGDRDFGGPSPVTRKAAAESLAEQRREELLEYERIEEPAAVEPMGALFLLPGEATP